MRKNSDGELTCLCTHCHSPGNLFIKTHSYSPSAQLSGERQSLGHDNFCCVLSRKLYVLRITFWCWQERREDSPFQRSYWEPWCEAGFPPSATILLALASLHVQPLVDKGACGPWNAIQGFSLPQICRPVPWHSQCSLGNYFRSGPSLLGPGLGWRVEKSVHQAAQMQEKHQGDSS